MVYSTDGITRAETMTAQNMLAALLSYKLNQEYSKKCGFVKARMSLAIVRSNSLLLHIPQDKEACIQQRPEMVDREVIALLVPWWG